MPIILHLNLKDIVNPTSQEADAACLKKGDFIQAVADDHQFSAFELSVPYWRMIRLTNATFEDVDHVLHSHQTEDAESLTQRRKYMFKFDSLLITANFQNFLDDDTRVVKIYDTPLSVTQLTEMRIERPARKRLV